MSAFDAEFAVMDECTPGLAEAMQTVCACAAAGKGTFFYFYFGSVEEAD